MPIANPSPQKKKKKIERRTEQKITFCLYVWCREEKYRFWKKEKKKRREREESDKSGDRTYGGSAWALIQYAFYFSILGHCYYFLCFSSPARVAFSENTKKKKKNFRNRPSCCPPAPGHTRLCLQVAWHDDWKPQSRRESGDSHFQVVAWSTKIVKESFFKLQSSWDGASKLKKMAFAIRWCVLEFFKPSTFASTLEARQRRRRSTTTLTRSTLRRSLLRQQIRGKVWRRSSP